MIYLPQNTLARLQAYPQFQQRNVGSLPLSTFAKNVRRRMDNGANNTNVGYAAQNFYMLNHLVSILKREFTPNEPLPPWAIDIVEDYLAVLSDQAIKLIAYVAIVTTREFRHHKGFTELQTKALQKEVGVVAGDFIVGLRGGSGEGTALTKFTHHSPPNATISQYFQGLDLGFQMEKKFEGGFGGKPWANIAATLQKHVDGVLTTEMFVDTAWTLAHNNGPMFNKGFIFDSNQNLTSLLDVQRSGQVPELCLDSLRYFDIDTSYSRHVKKLVSVFPTALTAYVDWYKVGDQYTTYQVKQDLAHPDSARTAERDRKAKERADRELAYLAQYKAEKEMETKAKWNHTQAHDGHFYITPNESVKIVHRITNPTASYS